MEVAALAGFWLGLGLILAIGAQNAFVLRQGLRREHVFAVCLFCAASDAALIIIGVSGFAAASLAAPWLAPVLRWLGVGFLTWYGARAFRAAWTGGAALAAGGGGVEPLGRVLAYLGALTWANPHVWLDTVVLLGSVSTQYPQQRLAFAGGAIASSFVFFFSLGYGARLLTPLFAKPGAWRVLDAVVGATMWSLATALAIG
jgi:L-lysine exporter family protein LysE/ArgO